MDVNALHSNRGSSATVASPVVPASTPVSNAERSIIQVPDKPVVREDRVELSKESQVAAAANALVLEQHALSIANGSRTYHDKSTNRFVVEVVNSNNEVIRQIPLEETLESTRRFRKLTGLIFNQEA
jgi:uncharacterized FlaG/YvyC family protein